MASMGIYVFKKKASSFTRGFGDRLWGTCLALAFAPVPAGGPCPCLEPFAALRAALGPPALHPWPPRPPCQPFSAPLGQQAAHPPTGPAPLFPPKRSSLTC